MRDVFLLLCAVLLIAAPPARAQGVAPGPSWTGIWDTHWREGGARLDLRQQGNKVEGTYPLYGGQVTAEVRGQELQGRWTEGDRFGTFVWVLSQDGSSFMGRFDTGEWWTGGRAPEGATALTRVQVDQATPRRALRTFLTAANRAGRGDVEAWGTAAAVLDFGEAGPRLRLGQRLTQAQNLFEAVDLTTFRLWSVPGRSAEGDVVQVVLPQAGTDEQLELTLRRVEGKWWIFPPSAEALAERVGALRKARGGAAPASDAYLALRSPRDVFLTLLDSQAPAATRLAAFDLSNVGEPVRAHEGGLAAEYLRQILDRIGPVLPQEVPDDPDARRPYVHFEHPAGRIVIARAAADAAGGETSEAPRWRFTAETVAALRPLYAAFEQMPPVPEATDPTRAPTGFFAVREQIRGIAPMLLQRVGPVEAWQIVGVLVVLGLGAALGLLVSWLGLHLLRLAAGVSAESASRLRWPLGLAVMSGLWFVGSSFLGLPEVVQQVLHACAAVTLAFALVWGGWYLVDMVGRRFARHAAQTGTSVDEILVSLLSGAAKLALVLGGFLYLAEALSIPFAGVLAGLGVGGLAFAFASRETLQNVFGAGILLTDRPFRRGDWIVAGDTKGAVEKVGIRSTRIRTAEDSLVVVPNGKLADSTINNLGTRRHRLVTSKLTLGWSAEPDAIEELIAGIREIVSARPEFASDRTMVGATGLGLDGIEVEFSCYLSVRTAREERAAKHALMLEVLRLARRLDLPLGPPETAVGPTSSGRLSLASA